MLAVKSVLDLPLPQSAAHLRGEARANAAAEQKGSDIAGEQADEVVDYRQQQGAADTEAGRLGGGGPAQVDAAQDDENQRQDGYHQQGKEKAFRPALPAPETGSGLARGDGRPDYRGDANHQHKDAGQNDAGDEAGQEKASDGFADGQSVEYQQDAGRDEDAEGAAGGQGADDQAFLVALGAERRQGNAADGGGSGNAGTGAGGKDGAGCNVGVYQSAGDELHPAGEGAVHQVGEAAAQDDFAHQDEQGDGDQVDIGVGFPGAVAHYVPDGVFGEQVEQDEGEGTEGASDIHTDEEHYAHQGEGYGNQHRAARQDGWAVGCRRAIC